MSRRIEEDRQSGSVTAPARPRARVIWAALAAVLVAAAPAAALAQTTDDADDAPQGNTREAARAAPTKPAKPADARKAKKSKRRGHADKAADGKSHAGKSKAHDDKSKAHDGASRGKSKSKKTAARASSKKKKAEGKKGAGAAAKAPQKPCFGPTITVDRGGLEAESFPLVDCAGAPIAQATQRLSILARPWAVARPEPSKAKTKAQQGKGERAAETASNEIAPGVRLLDPGLVTRVAAISKKFPGKNISLVSGYRPQSRGSLHQTARAIDLRVGGVDNADLAAFCRTLPDTGCGFYPNSSFIHVDVRAPGTGTVSWIDASGPGEAPKYVTAWPPPQGADADAPEAAPTPDDAHEHERAPAKSDATDPPDEDAPAGPSLLPALTGAPSP